MVSKSVTIHGVSHEPPTSKGKEQNMEKHVAEKITKQAEMWDMYAKLVPTLFLVVIALLIYCDCITIRQAFWIGVFGFSMTAVTWWFWALFTIKKLVNTLYKASSDLNEVRRDFLEVAKELEDMK